MKQHDVRDATDWRWLLMRSGIVTALLGVPITILLMYCAWLPYFMGAYFFILGGLLLGAAWFRQAARARPMSKRAVRAAAVLVLLALFAVYILSEYYVKRGHLARDMAVASMRRQSVKTADQKRERYGEAAAHVRGVLAQYGPGPVGYCLWVARSGEMPSLPPYGGPPVQLSQRGWFWIGRVMASMVLLAYGMHLQVKELAKPKPREQGPAPAETGP